MNKFYPLAHPFIDSEDKHIVQSVLESGELSLGPKYKEFEKKFACYIGTSYACSVSNGTCGLHLAVKAIGLNAGDEVITTPFSFISSTNCLLYERVKPIFVDIEETTFNIDAEKIEKAITNKTKALLIVHIFGQTGNMDKIQTIAKKHNLKIIEDACESLGSTFHGKKTGTLGDIGVFAFYPNKQMTTGEGGIIVTKNKQYYKLCSMLRNHGRNENDQWLKHEILGYNYRMHELSAALGITQLKKLDWMLKKRAQIASWYSKYLVHKDITLPTVGSDRTHTWFVYVIRVKKNKKADTMDKLQKLGIQTRSYLPVIHLQPFMKKMFGYKSGDYPIAERVSSETIALPFYIGLKQNDVQYIAGKIKQTLYEK